MTCGSYQLPASSRSSRIASAGVLTVGRNTRAWVIVSKASHAFTIRDPTGIISPFNLSG